MEILEILPNWVYLFTAPDSLTSSVLSKIRKEKWSRNTLNQITEEKHLHLKEEYKEITTWFNSCLDEVRNDLYLKCQHLDVCLMWANKSQFGEGHHNHKHPFSFASGVFYLTSHDNFTRFNASTHWSKEELLCVNPDTEDRHMSYGMGSEAGKLVIFPSSLKHSVDPLLEEETRYTISFNSLPCGQMGDIQAANALYLPRFRDAKKPE